MTPALEARLAEVLPCLDGADWECEKDDLEKCTPCQDRPAILALIRERERGERERCASQWREVYEIPMRDRIRALEDRND